MCVVMNKVWCTRNKLAFEVIKMSIIQCDEDCVYQEDGYCILDMPSAVTNYTGNGCVHCIHVLPRKDYEAGTAVFTPSEPQMPPAHYEHHTI